MDETLRTAITVGSGAAGLGLARFVLRALGVWKTMRDTDIGKTLDASAEMRSELRQDKAELRQENELLRVRLSNIESRMAAAEEAQLVAVREKEAARLQWMREREALMNEIEDLRAELRLLRRG